MLNLLIKIVQLLNWVLCKYQVRNEYYLLNYLCQKSGNCTGCPIIQAGNHGGLRKKVLTESGQNKSFRISQLTYKKRLFIKNIPS